MNRQLQLGFFIAILIGTTGLASAQTVSQYVESSSGEARIEVMANQPASFKIPRTVYGTFL